MKAIWPFPHSFGMSGVGSISGVTTFGLLPKDFKREEKQAQEDWILKLHKESDSCPGTLFP